jgi:hypothetical protein
MAHGPRWREPLRAVGFICLPGSHSEGGPGGAAPYAGIHSSSTVLFFHLCQLFVMSARDCLGF